MTKPHINKVGCEFRVSVELALASNFCFKSIASCAGQCNKDSVAVTAIAPTMVKRTVTGIPWRRIIMEAQQAAAMLADITAKLRKATPTLLGTMMDRSFVVTWKIWKAQKTCKQVAT